MNLGGQDKKAAPKYRRLNELAKNIFSDVKHEGDHIIYAAYSCMHLSRDKNIGVKRINGVLHEESEGVKLAQWHIHIVLWAYQGAKEIAEDIKKRWIDTAIKAGYKITPSTQEIKLCDSAGKLVYVMLQDLHNKTYGHIGERKAGKEDIVRKVESLLPKVSKDTADIWIGNLRTAYKQLSEKSQQEKIKADKSIDDLAHEIDIKKCMILTNHSTEKEVKRIAAILDSKRLHALIKT